MKQSRFFRLLDNDAIAAWVFMTPAMILLGLFVIWPIAYLFYLSFTAGSFTSTGIYWVGLKNYWRLLQNPDFWQVIFNTGYFTIGSIIPSLVIPLGLAALLNSSIPLRGVLRSAYFLPSIVSLVAAGLGFRWLFQTTGPVNELLNVFNIPPIAWLGDTFWAMPVIILFSIWKQIGFNMVVFLAGLQAIPTSRYEAAELDGANSWQQFWHITLPGLQPTLIFVTITTAIFTLRSFEPVYIITGGGPLNSTNLLVYYTYQEAFAQFDFGYAAAVATLLLAVTLILVYFQLRTWGEE
ncbi:sugar ABC transporter permease [Cronbergia sp. UHCC 0137]|uniref:carbohydrate ABC transporter permease n=1 Tax=Cronbergia sp. UHCC 0137 TaxID=3110239 RepID=UPI002B216A22|nr:sugar ABC transporter permease [Cronbergia sp. UHCC 0137]MEA5618955.1 sugar ABC transporter permease [Cronbergia sp. UHCC 0137]